MSSNTSEEKLQVFKGIILAWLLSLVFIGAGTYFSQSYNWFSNQTMAELLVMTLLPPSLALMAGIGWAARTRHFTQNIDGSNPVKGTPLDITRRYIQNTTEQIVLFSLAVFCFIGVAPNIAKNILPIMGLWFFIARLLFWVGYHRAPLSRATGFAATFHPTIALLLTSVLILLIGK